VEVREQQRTAVSLAARGDSRVGRVASAAGTRARSSDEPCGTFRRSCHEAVARRRRNPLGSEDCSSRLALGPKSPLRDPTDYYGGLLVS